MKKRYYFHAIGSACYDATGLTYPEKISCPFATLPGEFGAKNVDWIYFQGLKNVPKVVAFTADEKTKEDLVYVIKNHFCIDEVMVKEKNW